MSKYTEHLQISPAKLSKLVHRHDCHIPVYIYTNFEIDRHKYLVPRATTMQNFMYHIRKRLKLTPEVSLLVFTLDDHLVSLNELIDIVYKNHACGHLLVLKLTQEHVFG